MNQRNRLYRPAGILFCLLLVCCFCCACAKEKTPLLAATGQEQPAAVPETQQNQAAASQQQSTRTAPAKRQAQQETDSQTQQGAATPVPEKEQDKNTAGSREPAETTGSTPQQQGRVATGQGGTKQQSATGLTENPSYPTDSISLRLLAVGDNLIHGSIYRAAQQPDGSYDFTGVYQELAPFCQQADIAFVNLETPLGGKELGLSTYPRFNSPQEAGQALYDLGFNLISVANNHSLDAGEAGLQRTLAFWQQRGITPAGAGDLSLTEVNGVTIGLLAYTYGLNQGPTGLIDIASKSHISQQVSAARQQADLLIVSMHWGTEYQSQPNQTQQELAQYLASLGVDVVLGHHPHVVQPAVRLPKAGGGETLVFYSLGNFVSNQDKTERLIGGLAQVDLRYQPASGEVVFSQVDLSPLISHYGPGYQKTRVIPWQNYTPELAAQHGCPDTAFSYEALQTSILAAFPQEAAKQTP